MNNKQAKRLRKKANYHPSDSTNYFPIYRNINRELVNTGGIKCTGGRDRYLKAKKEYQNGN